jgi:hypothetical protein
MADIRLVYRLFEVGRDGHIEKPPFIQAFDCDEEAVAFAKRLLDSADIEVWQEKRLVARLKGEDRPD